jgi:hypothetical protein
MRLVTVSPLHQRAAIALALFSLLAGLIVAPAALAAPPSASGFVGNWTTTDCATSESGEIHCEVWGDGSTMGLHIGTGDEPRATFVDFYASSCANGGRPNTHWVGAGTGAYEDIFLFVTLNKTGCGVAQMNSEVVFQLYHDLGSDTLWEDEDGDGWGLMWFRHP